MNANLRKATNLFREFVEKNKRNPKIAECYMMWKDSQDIHLMPFALFKRNGKCDAKDEQIFFYAETQDFILNNLANIDYTTDDFETIEEFEEQVKKDFADFPEWFDFNGEDFVILDVISYLKKTGD